MRITLLTIAFSVLCVAGAVRPLFAQSLVEVARQEEERRKAIKQPSKVLTNKDLNTVLAATAPPPPATAPNSASGAAARVEAAKDADKKDAEPAKDQAYWSGRVKELQAQSARDQVLSDALQSRINALTSDFVNQADPARRAVIANDKRKAMDELNRLKQQIQNDKKAIADLQEEARRTGVPPGWLR